MPAKPLNAEQLADAERLREVFLRWQIEEKAAGRPFTQQYVGDELGFGQPNFNNYLKGRQPLNAEVLASFARLFRVAPEAISPSIAAASREEAQRWVQQQAKGNSEQYRELFTSEIAGTPQSPGLATGVTHRRNPLTGVPIWELPVVQGDQLKVLTEKNTDAQVSALQRETIEGPFDLDLSQDKVVELLIETPRSPRMKIGDKLVMRPMPDHQVSIKYLPVVVKTSGGEYFMMEYDRGLVENAGLEVIAYTVAWIQRPDQTITVITPKRLG